MSKQNDAHHHYLARWGRVDPAEYVSYWILVFPPIKLSESSGPVLNATFQRDGDFEADKSYLFPFSRDTCRILYHFGHPEQNSMCTYGGRGLEGTHENSSLTVVTRHFYLEVLHKTCPIEGAVKGRQRIWAGLKDSLFVGEHWNVDTILNVAERQKAHLEQLSAIRSADDLKPGNVEVVGLETGGEFFSTSELEEYLKKGSYKIYELPAVVI